MKIQLQPIAYGVKILFDDGTVVNWYRDSRRKTVHPEKNPLGHSFPAADPTGEGILRAVGLSREKEHRRLLGLPDNRPTDSGAAKRIPVAGFDGGCSPNPGPGGWGVVLPDGRELLGGELRTTNNRMELTAAIQALKSTEGPLHLVGDSSYVIRGVTDWLPGWIRRDWIKADKQPVLNVDLWKELASLIEGRKLTWELIKGHRGHPINERCDQLAALGRHEVIRNSKAG